MPYISFCLLNVKLANGMMNGVRYLCRDSKSKNEDWVDI